MRIQEHDVGIHRSKPLQAVEDQRLLGIDTVVAQDRVGAELPDHEFRLCRRDVALHALDHFLHVLAADAAIQDADRYAGKTGLEFRFKPGGIGEVDGARAGAGGRGGAECHNRHRLLLRDASG